MKTSNKILLSVFVLWVVILTAIHVALFAKYKSKDFETLDTERGGFEEHVLNNIHYVLMDDVHNISIQTANTPSLHRHKKETETSYKISGDTLLLYATPKEAETRIRFDYMVQLRLPPAVTVEARSAELRVDGPGDSSTAISQAFILKNSILTIGSEGLAARLKMYWDKLAVRATDGSTVHFEGLIRIRNMDITLSNSILEESSSILDEGGPILEKLNLATDDSSRIYLSSRNLKKLNLTPQQ